MTTWWGVVDRFLALNGDWTRSEVSTLEPLVNKVLLEHSHAHSYIYCVCCFYVTMAELSSVTETMWPAFYEKKIAIL